jgi:hypothetical protein
MIGRVEVFEILGMAGTCAALLFAGFSVGTLDGNVPPSWAATVEVQAPDVPPGLPDEVRLETRDLERPVHPAPPSLSPDPVPEPAYRPGSCVCAEVIS